ncbi:MAG: hypothetical protein ACFB15_31550 [Cyclobacteriaceae bacterium]
MSKYLLILFLSFFSIPTFGQSETEKPYVIENYYRIKWGHQETFIELYKKNHYPIVRKMQELGYITEIIAERSPFHTPEPNRWDFRIRLVFKNLAAAFEEEAWAEVSKELFPDRERLKQEEQKRFELLLAHWDFILTPVNLSE